MGILAKFAFLEDNTKKTGFWSLKKKERTEIIGHFFISDARQPWVKFVNIWDECFIEVPNI